MNNVCTTLLKLQSSKIAKSCCRFHSRKTCAGNEFSFSLSFPLVISQSLYQSFFVFSCLFFSTSVFLSFYLSIFQSTNLSFYVCLYVCMRIHLFLNSSIYYSIHLIICNFTNKETEESKKEQK